MLSIEGIPTTLQHSDFHPCTNPPIGGHEWSVWLDFLKPWSSYVSYSRVSNCYTSKQKPSPHQDPLFLPCQMQSGLRFQYSRVSSRLPRSWNSFANLGRKDFSKAGKSSIKDSHENEIILMCEPLPPTLWASWVLQGLSVRSGTFPDSSA